MIGTTSTTICRGHAAGDIVSDNYLVRSGAFKNGTLGSANYQIQGGGDRFGYFISGDAKNQTGTNINAATHDYVRFVSLGAKVIDLGNMILLPGLIDCHTHLLENLDPKLNSDDALLLTAASMTPAKRALLGSVMGRQDLEAGITSVRDLGNSGCGGDVALRDAINAGWVVGSRIFAATRALSYLGGQFGPLAPYAQFLIQQKYDVINGADDARRAVRQAVYDGADVIKVIVSNALTLDEMKAIVDEAHRMGKRVAAHATSRLSTITAVEAGVTSIEHGYTIEDSTLKIMGQEGIYLVPTDYPVDFYVSGLSGVTGMTPEERARRVASRQPSIMRARDRVNRAIKFGVKIAFGSDEHYIIPGRTRGQASLLPLEAYQDDGMPS